MSQMMMMMMLYLCNEKKTNPDQESIFGIFYFTVPLNYGETIMIAIEHMIR